MKERNKRNKRKTLDFHPAKPRFLVYATINGGLLIGTDIVSELLVYALLAPVVSPITFLFVGLAGPLVAILDGPLLFLLPLTLPTGLLSFASPIMRAKVMWKADWLSWIKLLFVVYATFLPASLGILFMIWR